MDFKTYKNYSWKYNFQGLGDLATKKLLYLNSSIPYNSFIFGSSRATSLYACYLNDKLADSNFFHYANWNETIGGIYEKLRLLDSLEYEIKNVVIYLDTDATFSGDGVVNENDHYLFTKQAKSDYYFTHFKRYFSGFSLDRFKILFGFQNISFEIFPNWESDIRTNDPEHICAKKILDEYGEIQNGDEFLRKIDSLKDSGFLYEREKTQKFREPQISKHERELILKIQSILDQHHARCFVVITPLYDQFKFAPSDTQFLLEVFKNDIYDFSGINDITDNKYNYPDRVHFQPYVSKQIVDSVIKSY